MAIVAYPIQGTSSTRITLVQLGMPTGIPIVITTRSPFLTSLLFFSMVIISSICNNRCQSSSTKKGTAPLTRVSRRALCKLEVNANIGQAPGKDLQSVFLW